MKKFSLLVMIFAAVLMVACNNNQNAAQDAGEDNVEATETVDSSKAEVNERQETNLNIKKTASRPDASKRGDFRLEDNSDIVYSGEFAYMADAAYFINCSTDSRYSVLMQDAFPDLEKKYLDVVGENAGSRVYIVVEGELQPKPAGEEGHFRGALKVSKVHSVNEGRGCNSIVSKMGGMFASYEGTATIKLCKNGQTYTILNEGAFKQMEKEYKELMEEGKMVYTEIYGYRKPIPAEQGGTRKTGMVVTRLVGFDSSYSCE